MVLLEPVQALIGHIARTMFVLLAKEIVIRILSALDLWCAEPTTVGIFTQMHKLLLIAA